LGFVEAEGRFNTLPDESILEGLDLGEAILRFLDSMLNFHWNSIAEKPCLFEDELKEVSCRLTADSQLILLGNEKIGKRRINRSRRLTSQ